MLHLAGRCAATEHEREVVRRHRDDLGGTEAGRRRDALDIVEVAHAPARIFGAQALVEPLVALRRVLAAAPERANALRGDRS